MNLNNKLYKILSKNENKCVIKLSAKNHPVFKAHFPDNEILPGFLQIDIIAEIFTHQIISIKKAKFISLILPNDIIEYNITSNSNNKYKIIINKSDKKVSEIIYETK
ncbi:MAG: hypothetical protein CL623_01730 [Arcobacter sp.]|nr:hypothetical protein [Arcobacter sp.]|tara:strand:- start:22498 stop:22818 length:321 start_codon:yes stop_codon:yes gene_type:complete